MEEHVGQAQPGLGEGLLAEKLVQLLAHNWTSIVIAVIILGMLFVVARRRASAVREASASA